MACFAAWMRNRSKAMAEQWTPGHQIGRGQSSVPIDEQVN